MRTRNLKAVVAGGFLLGSLAGLSGCSLFPGLKPGGSQRSSDEFTYVSTPWEPLTVTLYDRREDMPLWTVDVPVGSKVSIRFYANRETSGAVTRPDIMRWEIFDEDRNRSRLSNAMAVPGAESRLLQVSLRDELPEMPTELPDRPGLNDPDKMWTPVEPKRYRGVPVNDPSRGGTYYRAD